MGWQFVSLRRAWPAAVLLGLLVAGCSPEPRYESLPASYWLKELSEGNTSQRYHAAHALGVMGPSVKGAVPALTQALKDKNHLVRFEAVQALGKFGPAAREALPALRECLEDKDPTVRKAANVAVQIVDDSPEEGGK
jgi:HEAT repeat protein